MPNLAAIVALGKIAHDSVVVALGERMARFLRPWRAAMIGGLRIFDSYHCSRYNTNTGVLTPEMFRAVFADVRALLGPQAAAVPHLPQSPVD